MAENKLERETMYSGNDIFPNGKRVTEEDFNSHGFKCRHINGFAGLPKHHRNVRNLRNAGPPTLIFINNMGGRYLANKLNGRLKGKYEIIEYIPSRTD